MTEENIAEASGETESESSDIEEEMVTIWSPEAADNIEINSTPIDEWVRSLDFNTTEDVPIPERLVDRDRWARHSGRLWQIPGAA